MKANERKVGEVFSFQTPNGDKHEHKPMSVTVLKARNIKDKEIDILIPRQPASGYKLTELAEHFNKPKSK